MQDFPGGAGCKEPVCKYKKDVKRHGFDPGCQEDSLEESTATHSSILLENPMNKELGGL